MPGPEMIPRREPPSGGGREASGTAGVIWLGPIVSVKELLRVVRKLHVDGRGTELVRGASLTLG